jgi:hypothetical protein
MCESFDLLRDGPACVIVKHASRAAWRWVPMAWRRTARPQDRPDVRIRRHHCAELPAGRALRRDLSKQFVEVLMAPAFS